MKSIDTYGGKSRSSLRDIAEQRIAAEEAESQKPLSLENARTLVHELRVHQIELEMQNDELRRGQELLDAARARYVELYDMAPVGYLTLQDEDGQIKEVNLTAAAMWGVPRGAAIKSPLSRFILPADQDIFYHHRKKLFDTETPQAFELRMVHKDRGPFWVRVEAAAVWEEDTGRLVSRVALSDITWRKKAEAELIQANQELESRVRERSAELARSVEELKAEISRRVQVEHELRVSSEQANAHAAQLRALAGELTMAEQRERSRISKILHDGLQQGLAAAKLQMEGIADKLGKADCRHEMNEILGIISESLRMSRTLSADLSPPVLHAGGLKAGLTWLCRRMRDQHKFVVDLSLEAKPVLPENVRVLLFESVRELLFNAVKHSGVSWARVRLWQENGSGLHLSVSDEGAGFDPNQVASPNGDGGFGLFSVRERIALLGGHLEVDSSPGKGSRFTITLPCYEEPSAHEDSALLCRREGVTSQNPEPIIQVLLADDHALFRDGLARLLKAEPGIEVVGHAADGQEAIELCSRLQPNVILMDIGMPRVNGIEATATIHKRYPTIRIIALSMYEDELSIQKMRQAGAIDYRNKGCSGTELLAAIRGCKDAWKGAEDPVHSAKTPFKSRFI